MSTPHTMIPRPDELDAEFYKACVAANALCVQRCQDCGCWTHPARYYCPQCTSSNMAFEKTSGKAFIYSYTVTHYTVEASWKPYLPYVTIVAELEEGPRILATARDIAPEQCKIGAPIRITTEVKSPDFAVFWAEADPQAQARKGEGN